MTRLIIFEDGGWRDLAPPALTRATFELRCGCGTLLEKALSAMSARQATLLCRPMLTDVVMERCAAVAASPPADGEDALFINGRVLLRRRLELPGASAWWSGDTLVAARVQGRDVQGVTEWIMRRMMQDAAHAPAAGPAAGAPAAIAASANVSADAAGAGDIIRYPWDLIARNAEELRREIFAMPAGGGATPEGVFVLNKRDVRIGEGTQIKPATVLDAEAGPILIGRNVVISPNVTVRGPCHIGDGVVVQSGANIREGASIGPVCKVGGEIEGTIFQGYANKQHDGFIGHSYIGEWVNLGADTVTSDLKNTYGNVSVPLHGKEINTGQRFVGSIIGDHSKTGICTALNTGTVIGFSCNVVHSRPPRHIPTLTWLTEKGAERYDIERAILVGRTVMGRRKVEMSPAMERLFREIAAQSAVCPG